MIVKLYLYFGIIGIASILAWLGALALLANYAFHERRTFFFTRALVCSLLGILLAQINSYQVSRIQVDHRQEMQEAAQRQKQAQAAQQDAMQKRTADMHFAEDNAADRLDLAGKASDEKRSAYEKAAATDEKSGEEERQKSGRKRWQPIGAQTPGDKQALTATLGSEASAEAGPQVRMLPQHDINRADQLDILNLWVSRIVLLIVLLGLGLNYFRRFSQTVGALLPLPFSGRWTDSLFPKTHAAVFRAGKPGLSRSYLETVVRKGECFVYCGESGVPGPSAIARVYLPVRALWQYGLAVLRPVYLAQLASRIGRIPIAGRPLNTRLHWPSCPAIVRRLGVAAGRGSRKLFRRIVFSFLWLWQLLPSIPRLRRAITAARIPLDRHLRSITAYCTRKIKPLRYFIPTWRNGVIECCPVQILNVTSDPRTISHNFICECAWFNRYCFAAAGPDCAAALVSAFRQFLGERIPPRASAAQTVHLLWDLKTPLNPDLLHPLAVFSKEVNVKLVVFAADAQIAEVGRWMEEIGPDEAPQLARPTLAAFLMTQLRTMTGRITLGFEPWLAAQREKTKARRERIKAPEAPQPLATIPTPVTKEVESMPVRKPELQIPITKPPTQIAAAPAPKSTPKVPEVKAPVSAPIVMPKAKAPLPQPAPVPKPKTIIPALRVEPPPAPVVPQPVAAKAPETTKPVMPAPQPVAHIPKPVLEAKPPMPVAPPPTPAPVPAVTTPAPKPAPKVPQVKAPAPAPTVMPKAKAPLPQPAPVPQPQPKMEPVVPKPKVFTPQPHTVPKPVVKTTASGKPEDFSEIKLKPPETPAHVKLAPKIKMEMPLPPLSAPAEPEKPQPDAVGAPLAAPIHSAEESKPVAPAPTPPPAAPESAPEPAKAPVPPPPSAPLAEEPKKPEPVPEVQAPSSPIVEINPAAGVFKFYCPACQQKLSAKMDWQGKTIICPACKTAITIPAL